MSERKKKNEYLIDIVLGLLLLAAFILSFFRSLSIGNVLSIAVLVLVVLIGMRYMYRRAKSDQARRAEFKRERNERSGNQE